MYPTTPNADKDASILQLTLESAVREHAANGGNKHYGEVLGTYLDEVDIESSPTPIEIESIFLIMVTSALSILGSYVILREVLVDLQQRRGKTVSRLLMAMSAADLILSFGACMATFASPRDLDYLRYNVGNIATCDLQGFMMVLGTVASPLFNNALAFTYLRMIRHNATEQQLARFEPLTHGAIWGVALAVATFPLPLGMYNNSYETCWVKPAPYGCLDSDTCERGGQAAQRYNMFLTFFPSWPCALACGVIMCRIWGSVRHMENANAKYSTTSSAAGTSTHSESVVASSTSGQTTSTITPVPNRTKSNTVRQQALLYILAFFATYFLWWLDTLLWLLGVVPNYTGHLDLLAYCVMAPLQGFFNALVFVRQREMKTPEGRFFRTVVCCCPKLRQQKRKERKGASQEDNHRTTSPKQNLESGTEESCAAEANELSVTGGRTQALEQQSTAATSSPLHAEGTHNTFSGAKVLKDESTASFPTARQNESSLR